MLRRSTALAVAALCCLAPLAQAATFDAISQHRAISLSGSVMLVDTDSGITQTDSYSDSRSTAPGDFGDSTLDLGMRLQLDAAGGSVYDDGHTHLHSLAGGDRIAFEGLADVNASGYSSYPFLHSGDGGSRVDFEYRFSVAHDTSVMLTMNSATSLAFSDQFQFRLEHADGSTVWADTMVIDANDQLQTSFSQGLLLTAGEYRLNAQLKANTYLDSGFSIAGRASADFAITAVPEPSTLVLSLGGLALVAWRGRRLHSTRSGEAA